MPKKEKKIKVKGKVKNISQTVVVNVGGRKKSSAPTQVRPTPLQQATQFIQATRPQQGESLFQSSQLLQRLLEPTNLRLEALLRQQRQGMQPINIGQPNINVPINLPAQPNINIGQPNINVPINFPPQPISLPVKPRESVLDQPDEQLVTPTKPLVPAGPLRLDDPHEDVPIRDIEYVAEEKQEASQPASSSPISDDDIEPPGDFDYDNLTLNDLRKLQVDRRTNLGPSLREIAVHYGLQPGRKYRTKDKLIELIASNRGLN